MKRLFTTLALGLAVVSLASAACPYEITWATGSSYGTRIDVNEDMKVVSLQTVWGTFPDGTTLTIGEEKPVHITGPNVDKTTNLGGLPMVLDTSTGEYVTAPAIKINFQYYPLSIKTYGDYTATIPADSFTIDGVPNEEFDVTFTIEDSRVFTPVDLDCWATPDPGTYAELTGFTVEVNNEDEKGNTLYVSKGLKQGVKGTISMEGAETREFDIVTRPSSPSTLCYGLDLKDYTLKENGVYTVTWPEGAFLLESNSSPDLYTNKELKYVYTISSGTDMQPNITPAPGTVTALAGIEFEAPDGYEMSLVPEAAFTVLGPDGKTQTYEATISENRMYVYLRGEDINYLPGEYTVQIPRNSFNFIGSDDNEVPTNGFELKYNVTGGTLGELAYTISDEENQVVGSTLNTYKLQYLYLKFDEEVTPTKIIRTKVVYPDGSIKYATTSWSSGNKRFMIFMNYPSQKGKYEISFPAGAACADGVFNEEINITVNFLEKNVEDLVCTSDPKNGADVVELNVLTVNFDPELYTSVSPFLGGITKSYLANDNDQDNPIMCYLDAGSDALSLSASLKSKITEIGDYTWSIPEGSVLAVKKDGTQVLNSALTFFWRVRENASITESFSSDVTDFTVYDMNGVCLLKKGTREDLKSLGKGIFVINGKTFVIR